LDWDWSLKMADLSGSRALCPGVVGTDSRLIPDLTRRATCNTYTLVV
jgi:hypothetical protein